MRLYVLVAILSRSMPPSHTQSFPSIMPSTKASGAEGSATISAAVARVKSSPTTLYPSFVLFKDPTPLDETPSLTPSPNTVSYTHLRAHET